MKKLILHCGLHKTGTSSLQLFLYKNRNKMLEQGVDIFDEYPNGENKFGNLSAWIDHSSIIKSDIKTESKVKSKLYNALKKRVADKAETTVVFSSEALSWVLKEENIKDLAENLNCIFDVVEIVFYLRRQDKFAISHYGQRTKNYSFEKFFYKGNNEALPFLEENSLAYLDFNLRYEYYTQYFGKRNVIFKIFEPKSLYQGDISKDFLKLIGVNLDGVCETQNINKSNNFLQQKVNGYLCDNDIQEKSIATMIANKLKSDRVLICEKVKAKNFMGSFELSNNKLAVALGIENGKLFDDSFDFYPENIDLKYCHDDCEKIIKAISVNLDKEIYLSERAFTDILNTAKIIQKTNPTESLSLLLLLKSFRPDGIVLNKILKDLEN